MKRFMLLGAVFLLAGCPGYKAPIVPEHPAQAMLRDNKICIQAPTEEGEYITSVQLYSKAGQRMHKLFNSPSEWIYAEKGKCLPTFDFEFRPGNAYAAYYSLEKSGTAPVRMFAARFSLEQDGNGRLRLIGKTQ